MYKTGGQSSDSGKETNFGERAGGPAEGIITTVGARSDNPEGGADPQKANLGEKNREPQDPAAASTWLEDDSTSKMAWSPTRIIGHKRTLAERPGEEEDSEVDELEEDEEEEEEEGSEEDLFEQGRMQDEGDCEARENDSRAENKNAEVVYFKATDQTVSEEGEESSAKAAEDPGSREILRLETPTDKGSEQLDNQMPEKSADYDQLLTGTSLPQQSRCWPGADQGAQGAQQDPSTTRADLQPSEGSLQVQTHGQAGSSLLEGRREMYQEHRQRSEAEKGDEGGSGRSQPSPERKEGQTALHLEGDQEASRLGAAELHQRTLGIQGHQGDKDEFQPSDVEMIKGTVPPPRGEYYHAPHTLSTEVILETQLNPSSRGKGSIYNDILASIGLDSPTPSFETRRKEDSNTSPRAQLINTPIRNSASSLIALGKQVLTPRQSRIWELRNKAPLGGQGNQFGGSLP